MVIAGELPTLCKAFQAKIHLGTPLTSGAAQQRKSTKAAELVRGIAEFCCQEADANTESCYGIQIRCRVAFA